jgi:DNA-binding transcriptional LysR family regulator
MLDPVKLHTLVAVIREGSFSKAGRHLTLTQPAVSRQVSLLEAQVGVQLVLRSKQGVMPTEAGRFLVGHAEAVLARLALAEEGLSEFAGLQRGRVRLGSFFTALAMLTPGVSARAGTSLPELAIEDELVDRQGAFEGLRSGRLDVAVVFEHAFEPAPPAEDIEIVTLFADPLRVLLPAQHRLATRKKVPLKALAADTWVRPREGGATRLVEHVLAEAGLRPPVLDAGAGEEPVETQGFVAAGRGVTIAHELNIIVNPEEIAVRPLVPAGPVRHVQAAVLRANRAQGPRALFELLRDLGRERRRHGSKS